MRSCRASILCSARNVRWAFIRRHPGKPAVSCVLAGLRVRLVLLGLWHALLVVLVSMVRPFVVSVRLGLISRRQVRVVVYPVLLEVSVA